MDADTRTLIERTRQRREILNQRFAGMPEAAPRKRRTPVLENERSEKQTSSSADQDDSPKRQCLRDVELNVKPDTPAIQGVQSRIKDLKYGDGKDENNGEGTPTPKPRKSVSSPPLERKSVPSPKTSPVKPAPSSTRKNRFAALAQSINNWEDDLTHHVIHKEEKKPRWQPPSNTGNAPGTPNKGSASPVKVTSSSHLKSSLETKSASPMKVVGSPARATQGHSSHVMPSPKKTPAPPVPHEKASSSPAAILSRNSPLRSSKIPVSSLSASTPASTVASVSASTSKVQDPSELPVAQRMSQMQEKLTRKQQDEPTAYSVNARMSAWEDMTSANKVCDVKKVDPAQVTPFGGSKPKSASVFTPKSTASVPRVAPKSASAPMAVTSVVPANPPPPPVSHGKAVVPSKSFKESIEEKAAEVSRRTGLQYSNRSPVKSTAIMGSPNRAVTHSPNKVSAGTKGVQQLLVEQCQESVTTCSQMAAQSRAARAAELAALSNRFKNGILRDNASSSDEAVPPSEQMQEQAPRVEALTPGKDKPDVKIPTPSSSHRREAGREKARADFNSKLAKMGMDADETKRNTPAVMAPQKTESGKGHTASIYSLIKKRDEATPTEPEENKKVKFNDSFDDSDDEPERKIPKSAAKKMAKNVSPEFDDIEVFKKPTAHLNMVDAEFIEPRNSDLMTDRHILEVSDDDISLRGFVSEATRRESIFGHPKPSSRTSASSVDSYGDSEGGLKSGLDTAPSNHKVGYQPDEESLASGDDENDELEDASYNRKAVSDLLDDAFDDTMDEGYDPDMDPKNVVMRKKQPCQVVQDDEYDPDMDVNNVVMRKKPNYTNSVGSTADDDDDDEDNRPYSLAAYRKSATINQHMMAPVVRSSKYVGKHVVEEDISMPYTSAQPRTDDRRAVHERIKELKELVQQEQSVIMQTSNALNKCCLGNPIFAGSSEQVECNRVLLLACQKRQCYMTEIERLKATGQLSAEGPGPQGSLTISDIRLPLKRDFVTKIGTSHDNTTHYFILLIRNGAQLICTQMLSTHDPMMRGSLDFPNLIKINGITGNFKLTVDIYGMSVSREAVGKDKKKKTPKKSKGLVCESPGGPRAVRTTSFSHVTSIELTRKMLDKSSFHLERLSYLSPLYGQIYMRLKCLMESNVEERGFLTMFDDVSGFGAWHRRWCVLTGNKLCIWKYPDDETRKDPMAVIDLKRCVSEKVGLVSREFCARPNTFEMVTVRQPLKGEHDTLVTRTYNSTTSVKYLMSADSKEERIVWCNKVNRTLANLRTWNADALKPMRPPGPHSGAQSSSRR